MPKQLRHFRLSEEAIAILKKYATTHDLKNISEALREIIRENERLHMYISYLGDIRGVSTEAPCKRRLFFNGEWYCISRAQAGSGPKSTKLLSLEICTICKAQLWKLPEKAETKPIPAAPKLPTTQKKRWEPGMDIYCSYGGMYVFPSACKACTHPCDLKPKE